MRHRIRRINGEVVEGEMVPTPKGSPDYPSFRLDDGSLIGVHYSAVLGTVDDDCGPRGIERPELTEDDFYWGEGPRGPVSEG